MPGFNLTLSHWEVLNEIEGEHSMDPATYTAVYVAIVAGIKRWAPVGSKSMKFVGLALEGSEHVDYVSYLLNATNRHDTQIDMVSFHHYASADRDGGVNFTSYEGFFPSADAWLLQVQAISDVRDQLAPAVLLDADEGACASALRVRALGCAHAHARDGVGARVFARSNPPPAFPPPPPPFRTSPVGVILSDDNDPKWTSGSPGFGPLYWNAAAGSYAYLYGRSSVLGLDVLGESQMVGYPSLNFTRGAPINGLWTAPPQYPSVALLNWTDGSGTARYWALKLLQDSMRPGAPAGRASAAEADAVVATATSASNSTPASGGFCGSVVNLDTLALACDAPGATIAAVQFASYGTPTGTCGSYAVGACNAANSTSIVESYCLGKPACSVPATTPIFGDPCYGTVRGVGAAGGGGGGAGARFHPAAGARAHTHAASTPQSCVCARPPPRLPPPGSNPPAPTPPRRSRTSWFR